MRIKLTAKDMCPFRKTRLKIVSKFYNIFIGKKDIVRLHDHEGCLSVYWLDEPNEEQKKVIKDIWEALREDCINHFIYKEL